MRLTELQAEWYRKLIDEGVEDGLTLEEARRDTYAYWREYVAPDWRGWLYANTHEDLLAPLFGAFQGLAALTLIVRHADRVGGLLSEMAEPLRLAIGE